MPGRAFIKTGKTDTRKETTVIRTQKSVPGPTVSTPVDHITFLQRTIGNKSVERMYEYGVLRAKLKIGEPNDVYEQEADQVAEQVMRMPEDSAISGQRSAIGREDMIQLKPG